MLDELGRHGPRPQHSTDGQVTKGIPREVYDKQYKQLGAADFDADEWITVHTGTSIRGDCNIILEKREQSDAFRLQILKWDGYMNLNSVELHG